MGIGDIFSTGGRGAQGDLAGAGAEGLATSVGFSDGAFRTSPPVFGCPADPTLSTVAFGPTVVVGFVGSNFDFSISSSSSFCFAAKAAV